VKKFKLVRDVLLALKEIVAAHQAALEDHEARIKALESASPVPASAQFPFDQLQTVWALKQTNVSDCGCPMDGSYVCYNSACPRAPRVSC